MWFLLVVLVLPILGLHQTTYVEKSLAFQKELFVQPEMGVAAHGRELLDPTVLIAVFVRNKEHSLPYFLRCLEDLKHSKKRTGLW